MDAKVLKIFVDRMQKKHIEIKRAQEAYFMAKALEETIKETAEEIQREILLKNVYVVMPEFAEKRGVSERITEPHNTYLMDDEIFQNDFLEKCYPEYIKAGIADKRGKEWLPEADAKDARIEAEKILLEIAIDVLPDELIEEKTVLRKATLNWKYREQILNLILSV